MNPKRPHTPHISIAMATYNGAKYLLEQLDSLAAQTHPPCELVVTDDVSTDDTLEILYAFALHARFPVRVHRNERRLGYRDNFLKAAKLCTGELIAFCDQDDVWMANKLEQVAREFDDPEVLLVIHDIKVVTDMLEAERDYRAPNCNIPFAVQYGNSMVFRASMPLNIDIDRPRSERDPDKSPLAHDEWIPFLASSLGRCINIHSPLILYRQHGNNVCGFGPREKVWSESESDQYALRFQHRSLRAHEHASTLRTLIAEANLSQNRRMQALSSLARWERYSRLLHSRSELYKGDLVLLSRLKRLMHILFLRGYTKIQLGRKAFIKDALFAFRGE